LQERVAARRRNRGHSAAQGRRNFDPFDETLERVERWNLDQYLKKKTFDNLVYRVAGVTRIPAHGAVSLFGPD
jgi:hypothetical protein